MKPKLLLCLAWGLLCTYCLIIPYGFFAAWIGLAKWKLGHEPSWWEMIRSTLTISCYVFVASWYLTLPLVAVITWCLYLRGRARAAIKEQTSKTKP